MHRHFPCLLAILIMYMLPQALGRPSAVSVNFLGVFLHTSNS